MVQRLSTEASSHRVATLRAARDENLEGSYQAWSAAVLGAGVEPVAQNEGDAEGDEDARVALDELLDELEAEDTSDDDDDID